MTAIGAAGRVRDTHGDRSYTPESGGTTPVNGHGSPMHKGEPIRALEAQFADRLILEQLTPWAPMLNPVEPLWSWLKWERLSNFAAHDVHELDERVVGVLASKRDD